MINCSIPDIFDYLTVNYYRLSPSQLTQREQRIDDMIYDTSQHIDTVFTKIQRFLYLCTLLKCNKTEQQLINYAYLIFQKIGVFQNSLIKWNEKTENTTWNEFRIFMRI